MEPMELVGTEYLPKALLKRIRSGKYAKLYWDEVPAIFMATETDLRPHHRQMVGRQMKEQLVPMTNNDIKEDHDKRTSKEIIDELGWNGCGRAVVERLAYWEYPSAHPYYAMDRYLGNTDGILFRRCHYVADSTGFCKVHKARAIKDGRVSEFEINKLRGTPVYDIIKEGRSR
tara:strand:+ start:19 stop:537 length:519 start_codon:yes stop_codon:yes gene_type:complete